MSNELSKRSVYFSESNLESQNYHSYKNSILSFQIAKVILFRNKSISNVQYNITFCSHVEITKEGRGEIT